MHADLALMLLVLVFGCAAFLFGIVYFVYWMLSMVWGGLVTVVTPASKKPWSSRARSRSTSHPNYTRD